MPNEHPEIMYNYYYSIYSKQESTNYTDFETVRGQVVNYTSLNLFLSIHFLAQKSTNGQDGTKQRFNQ